MSSKNYELEVWHDGRAERIIGARSGDREGASSSPPNGPISSLIVCLKTSATVSALQILKARISPSSVITLVQNGMGVYDELCSSIWPDPKTRPYFIIGTTTHGVSPGDQRGVVRHQSKGGEGEVKWGVVPDPRNEVDLEAWLWGQHVASSPILAPPSAPGLPLRSIPRCTTDLRPLSDTITALLSLSLLSPTLLPMPHLHHQQLLKLALNSVINPLTAILGAGSLPNGALFGSIPSQRLIRGLVREISKVLTAYLHTLSSPHAPPPDVIRLFSPEGLEKRVVSLIQSTAQNRSSMAVDVSMGRTTEIEHINGYLIALGRRLGIDTIHHRMLRDMVKFTAEINGLKTDSQHGTPEQVADRRADIQAKLGQPRKLSPKETELEEKRLELQERQIWVEEDRLLQLKRERRKAAKRVVTFRRDREAAERARFGGPKESMDDWIATAPRWERTWDVPSDVPDRMEESSRDGSLAEDSRPPVQATVWDKIRPTESSIAASNPAASAQRESLNDPSTGDRLSASVSTETEPLNRPEPTRPATIT